MEFSMEPFVRYIAKTSYYIDRELVANDCRILYVVSGDGQFESGNKAYPLSAGALVCYPYGIPYRVSSQTGLTFYTINFDFDFENSNISTMMPKETYNHKPQNEIHSIKQQWQATFLKVNFLEKAFWADELFAGIYNEAVNKKDGYQKGNRLEITYRIFTVFQEFVFLIITV